MSKEKFILRFGALADPLAKQLEEQGYICASIDIAHFQKDIEARNRLRIRGYLTDSEIDKISKRIHKEIAASVVKKAKPANEPPQTQQG